VSLLDLIEEGLIDRFGFDPLAPVSIGDLILVRNRRPRRPGA
jgi:hypothetical protein